MKIRESFIKQILQEDFPADFQNIYEQSCLIQYLDYKMKAVHYHEKARRSLGNIYAVYALLTFYIQPFWENKEAYRTFEGFPFTDLLRFCRNCYGGSKLQNHALNSRVNGEFTNFLKKHCKFNGNSNLIIINHQKYLLHIDHLYVKGHDISKTAVRIIKRYVELLQEKDLSFTRMLNELKKTTQTEDKRKRIQNLLKEKTEARIFEIITYAILKNHYKNIVIYWGYSQTDLQKENLKLFKTGRTNANDGGIDFVMRPLGRFFQVTEVDHYNKYLLDIEKVLHFPITFVIKTHQKKEVVLSDIEKYITQHTGGMEILEKRYRSAFEEIITINELELWLKNLSAKDLDQIIKDIETVFNLEMNIEDQ